MASHQARWTLHGAIVDFRLAAGSVGNKRDLNFEVTHADVLDGALEVQRLGEVSEDPLRRETVRRDG